MEQELDQLYQWKIGLIPKIGLEMKKQQKAAVVPSITTGWYPPGLNCTTATAGDIILVRLYKTSFFGKIAGALIRFGAWIRKSSRPYSWTEHAMTVVRGGPNAIVVQETAKGSVYTSLSTFSSALYVVIHPIVAQNLRDQAVAFANWTVGSKYGFVSIISDGLDDITGWHFAFSTWGRMVCSAAACRSAERWGLIPDKESDSVQPADLARYFNISKEKSLAVLEQSKYKSSLSKVDPPTIP